MANLHLITGYKGEVHITAADDGAFNASIFGSSNYVLPKGNKFSAQIISNNRVRINDGDILLQGRHIRLNEGGYVDLDIDNGTNGKYRNDLIVCRYEKNSGTGVEEANLVVIKGTEAATNPSDPAFNDGDLLTDHDLIVDFPLYRVSLNGLNIEPLETLFKEIKSGIADMKTDYNAEAEENTLADGDYFPFYDASAPGNRKTKWSNIKSKLKAYFDGIYGINGKTAQSSLANDDAIPFYDTSASAERKFTLTNLKSFLKSYTDTLYAALSHNHTVSNISDLTASATELNYTDGVTSNIQTQLNGKAASSHNHTLSNITDITVTATIINRLSGLNDNIMTLLNSKISAADKGVANGVASLDANGKVNANQAASTVVPVTANRTISLADAGKFLCCTSSDGATITIPSKSSADLPVGTEIEIYRGSGAITVQAAANVTLYSPYITVAAGNSCVISERYAVVSLKMYADDSWVVSGMVE